MVPGLVVEGDLVVDEVAGVVLRSVLLYALGARREDLKGGGGRGGEAARTVVDAVDSTVGASGVGHLEDHLHVVVAAISV